MLLASVGYRSRQGFLGALYSKRWPHFQNLEFEIVSFFLTLSGWQNYLYTSRVETIGGVVGVERAPGTLTHESREMP